MATVHVLRNLYFGDRRNLKQRTNCARQTLESARRPVVDFPDLADRRSRRLSARALRELPRQPGRTATLGKGAPPPWGDTELDETDHMSDVDSKTGSLSWRWPRLPRRIPPDRNPVPGGWTGRTRMTCGFGGTRRDFRSGSVNCWAMTNGDRSFRRIRAGPRRPLTYVTTTSPELVAGAATIQRRAFEQAIKASGGRSSRPSPGDWRGPVNHGRFTESARARFLAQFPPALPGRPPGRYRRARFNWGRWCLSSPVAGWRWRWQTWRGRRGLVGLRAGRTVRLRTRDGSSSTPRLTSNRAARHGPPEPLCPRYPSSDEATGLDRLTC